MKTPSTTTVQLCIRGKKEQVPVSEIMLMESQRNYTLFYLADGRQVLSYKTLGLFDELVENVPFLVRPNRSYIVNLSYISAQVSDVICLWNGKEIKVSKWKVPFIKAKQRNIASFQQYMQMAG